MPSGSKVLIRTVRAHVYCSTALPCVTDLQTHAMTSCMLSLLDHWSSRGILALTPGGQEVTGWDNHPLATCDFDMETNFVLNVIPRCLERSRPAPRPLFVRFVRAQRRCVFKRRDPWIATTLLAQGATVFTMSTRGWKLSKQRSVLTLERKTINTRCDQMRSCNRFSCAYPPAFFFRSVVVVVCCCCCCSEDAMSVCISTSPQSNWQGEPSMAKNSSPSRAPKNGAQLQTTWRSAKNAAFHGEKSLLTAITAIRGSYRQGRRGPCRWTASAEPLQFSALSRQTPVVAHQRACQRPCPRTGRTMSTTCTTGTSTTLSAYCNSGHMSLHNSGHVNNLQELHLEREGLHCGYLSLRHNWNVQHSEEELSLRHLQLEPLGTAGTRRCRTQGRPQPRICSTQTL